MWCYRIVITLYTDVAKYMINERDLRNTSTHGYMKCRVCVPDVNGAHSGPASEKQSPMVAQKHSPQTQSSPAAQQSPTITQPSPPAPHPSPATTQPSPLLVEPGPGAAHISPPVTQSSIPMSQPSLEAMQSVSVVTQAAAAAVDPGMPGVQPSSIGSVPVPPQLYLHDTRYWAKFYSVLCL